MQTGYIYSRIFLIVAMTAALSGSGCVDSVFRISPSSPPSALWASNDGASSSSRSRVEYWIYPHGNVAAKIRRPNGKRVKIHGGTYSEIGLDKLEFTFGGRSERYRVLKGTNKLIVVPKVEEGTSLPGG